MTDAAHNQHSETRRPSDRDRIATTGPIENAAKMLGQPIVVSAELAAALDGVVSLGRHQRRGLATPHELFAPV